MSRTLVWLVFWLVMLGHSMPAVRAQSMPDTLPDDSPPGEAEPSSPASDAEAPAPSSDYAPPPIRFEANVFAALGVPFGQSHAQVGMGFGLTYGIAWSALPISLGLDFLSISSDYERMRSVELSDGSRDAASQTARNRTLYFDAWLRVQPANWPVRPYAEAFVGTKLAQTRYMLTWPATRAAGGGGHSDPVDDDDWVASWGWGVGVDTWGLFRFLGMCSFTLGMRQLYGGTAHFERPVAIAGEVVNARYTQNTTLTFFMLGIIARMDLGEDPDPYAARY